MKCGSVTVPLWQTVIAWQASPWMTAGRLTFSGKTMGTFSSSIWEMRWAVLNRTCPVLQFEWCLYNSLCEVKWKIWEKTLKVKKDSSHEIESVVIYSTTLFQNHETFNLQNANEDLNFLSPIFVHLLKCACFSSRNQQGLFSRVKQARSHFCLPNLMRSMNVLIMYVCI